MSYQSLRVGTDRKYLVGIRYMVSKYASFSTNFDIDIVKAYSTVVLRCWLRVRNSGGPQGALRCAA